MAVPERSDFFFREPTDEDWPAISFWRIEA